MKFNLSKKLLGLAILATLAAPAAQAATASGTVTITGTVIATCTVSSPTVTFNFPIGSGPQLMPVNVDVTCPNTVTWSLSSPIGQSITIGSTTNYAQMMNSTGAATIPSGNPITGTGTGAVQTQNLNVQIYGNGTANATQGYGAITGTLPLTLTY
jgi:type 1 fimbria pilin